MITEYMDKQLFREKLREAVLNSIKERVQDGYARSQSVVPIVTGKLKRSGLESETDEGAKIFYGADYASFVERGMQEHYEHVNSFFRKNGTFVKGFTRHMPKTEAKNYIRNSIKGAFEKFASTLDSNLRAKFKSVNWK